MLSSHKYLAFEVYMRASPAVFLRQSIRLRQSIPGKYDWKH